MFLTSDKLFAVVRKRRRSGSMSQRWLPRRRIPSQNGWICWPARYVLCAIAPQLHSHAHGCNANLLCQVMRGAVWSGAPWSGAIFAVRAALWSPQNLEQAVGQKLLASCPRGLLVVERNQKSQTYTKLFGEVRSGVQDDSAWKDNLIGMGSGGGVPRLFGHNGKVTVFSTLTSASPPNSKHQILPLGELGRMWHVCSAAHRSQTSNMI